MPLSLGWFIGSLLIYTFFRGITETHPVEIFPKNPLWKIRGVLLSSSKKEFVIPDVSDVTQPQNGLEGTSKCHLVQLPLEDLIFKSIYGFERNFGISCLILLEVLKKTSGCGTS